MDSWLSGPLRVITEPAGKEPKQAQPEKNDKSGEGSVVPKKDNPINAPEPDSECIETIATASGAGEQTQTIRILHLENRKSC